MQVAKLGRKQGLAPVGSYFEAIARDLREAKLQAELDQEDRDLEMLYRQHSGARANVYAEAAA